MSSSTSTFNYWSLLGLSPGSNDEQIKKAFRREAMRWHPDTNRNNRNAEERFKWINEAYKVLSDPKRRFEWEIAGRPTFQIESPSNREDHIETPTINRVPEESKKINFNPAERLMIFIVAVLSLLLLNTFIL